MNTKKKLFSNVRLLESFFIVNQLVLNVIKIGFRYLYP